MASTSTPLEVALALAWAAGFIDGEGCIHIVKQRLRGRRETYRLRLAVTQNNLEVLEETRRILTAGGNIYRLARRRTHNRQCYVLTYDGPSAWAAIRAITPYLRRKQPEATIAREFVEDGRMSAHSGPRGHPEALWKLRDSLYRKLRKLK